MATSGSVDFSVSRDDIIKAALQRIGVVAVGGTPSASQYTEGALLLNGIVKSWNAILGIPLWATTYYYFLPFSGTYAGNFSSGHVTTSYTHTTVAAAASSGAATITVASTTGIANTYNIGVELDSGDMHWTTVNGVPSGVTITLTDTLTDDVAIGNRVYVYQTRASRPLRIIYAYTSDGSILDNNNTIPVNVITKEEFDRLSDPSLESSNPLYISYTPSLIGQYTIWPRFQNGDRIIGARVHRALEDFDASGNTPDFPQEYYLPLVFELACILAPQYGKPVQEQQWLRREADKLLEAVAQNDYEEGSIYFQPSSFG